MENNNSSNKRLFKNTILLYVRSFLTMAIGLYTSRIVLRLLGVEDYGIYNIVGGFVSFFSILSNTLVASSQRFITFELGKGKDSNPRKVFSASMMIHIVLSIVLFLIFESVGLWFLNCKLNIPHERLFAANWVFQFSVLSFLINVLSSPYTAVIIAYERMKVFAFISLLDVVLKLLLVFLLYYLPSDKLIMFSLSILLISLIDRIIYSTYCRMHFNITKLMRVKDMALYKEMTGFSGMNFLGSFASILSNHGMNILLNLFFGVRINAARGVANQVLSAVSKFVHDFMTALDPQITKEYSSGNKISSQELCFMGSKFSAYLMFLMGFPLIFKAPYILHLWLGNYPEYAVVFVRCSLILSFFTVLSKPLVTEILATGNLKSTVLWIGSAILTALPLAYIFFRFDYGPEYSYYVLIFVEVISLNIRLIVLGKISGISFLKPFYKKVLLNLLFISLVLIAINAPLNKITEDCLIGLLIYVLLSVTTGVCSILLIGLKKAERVALLSYIFRKKSIKI